MYFPSLWLHVAQGLAKTDVLFTYLLVLWGFLAQCPLKLCNSLALNMSQSNIPQFCCV